MPLDVKQELQENYVQPCTEVYGLEDVSVGIRYLDTLNGGIANHRDKDHLSNAITHIHAMRKRGRIKSNGLPDDFSLQELAGILVKSGSDNSMNDIKIAVDRCCSEGYFPDPMECADRIHRMKEELWDNLEEKDTEISHSRNVFAESQTALVGEIADLKLSTGNKIKGLMSTIQQQAEIIQKQAKANKEKDDTIQRQAKTIQQQADAIQKIVMQFNKWIA